jgi:peptidyl-dipeptidase Dcp
VAARKEVSDLVAFARSEGFGEDEFMPWDFAYWSERYQKKLFDIDETLLKPYFRMEDSLEAVFSLAGKLYGVSFKPREDIPGYHPEVRVFEVLDEDGKHLALFYVDPFPRKSKRGGAWMTEFMGQYEYGGVDYRPFVSIVMNFSRPSAQGPSLLTHDELTTLLHEFGHSLHGMLSKCRYPSQAGTNVARDFVELPSQIMENWAYEKEFLDSFARHYLTGEKIPAEYIDNLIKARNFQAGYLQVRQLQFGVLDMAWHTLKEEPSAGVVEFEKNALSSYLTLPYVEGTAISPTFGHIFSGGYSAGYYSYKWAEVLEADAFSLFSENGIFDKATASSFRKNILERGSSEDEMVSYVNFRGHPHEAAALLKKLGII